eukprot:scaffold70671_cov77-Phaeocystis_antarctica.AAC.1
MTEQLRQFYALSSEQQAAATKVKTVVSNIITISLWSLVALTVIAAVVAGLHFVALGVPGSSTLSQMNSDHLEVRGMPRWRDRFLSRALRYKGELLGI